MSRSLPAPKELSAASTRGGVRDGSRSGASTKANNPLRQLGIDGSFPQTQGGDLLAVTAQNTGNNKIDTFLHTSIADHIGFDPGTGTERSVVDVSLANDAPAKGLPPVVIVSPADPGLAPGTNETWLTVYSPLSLSGVTVDGAKVTMSATRELGVWAYSTYADIAARSFRHCACSPSWDRGCRLDTAHVHTTPTFSQSRASPGHGDARWRLEPCHRQRPGTLGPWSRHAPDEDLSFCFQMISAVAAPDEDP